MVLATNKSKRLHKDGVTLDVDLDISSIVDLYRERVKTINELAQSILYVFQDFDEYDPKAAKKAFKEVALQPLQMLHDMFAELDSWNAKKIHQVIQQITEQLQVNMGKVGQPLRVAVTGGSFSPPIDQTAELIGKEKSLARILRAIQYIKSSIA